MGFRKNAWATVWSIENGRNNSLRIRISTSRKKKDGKYEQDFSGYCTLLKDAKEKGANLQVRDRIQIGDTEVTTFYSKKKKKEYTTYKIYDFEKSAPKPDKKTEDKNDA